MFFDIELIDVSDNVENFKLHKIYKEDLDKLLLDFKSEFSDFIEFSCLEGRVLFKKSYFRGIMYTEHVAAALTINQENAESAQEISKINIKKTIFSPSGGCKEI